MNGLRKVWGHRTADPAATLERAKPFFDVAGITRLANVTGLDRLGLPVVMVMRPNARSVSVFAGKGLTLDAALASGAMEGIEAHHAEHLAAPIRYCRRDDLPESRAAAWSALPLLAGADTNAAEPLPWIAARCLVSDREWFVPFELVSTDFSQPRLPGFGRFLQSTNGLASGNCREEALLHALCELVERDAVAHWQRKGHADRRVRRVDTSTIADATTIELLDRMSTAGFSPAVWDVTSDLAIPCFHAILLDRAESGHHGTGSGCHPSPRAALLRALTEAAQVRLTYVSGARDDIDRFDYSPAARLDMRRRLEAIIADTPAVQSFAACAGFESDDIGADLDWLVERLRSRGFEDILCVDLTKPRIGIPVVKVVVPGLLGPEAFPGELATASRLAA